MYLPFLVTIISFVMHWNLVQSSRSSNDKDSGNPWLPGIAAGGPRLCLAIEPRSSRSSRSSTGLVRLCLPPRSRSRSRSCSRSLSRSLSRSWHEERVGEPGVRGAPAGCIFSVLQYVTLDPLTLSEMFSNWKFNRDSDSRSKLIIRTVYEKKKQKLHAMQCIFQTRTLTIGERRMKIWIAFVVDCGSRIRDVPREKRIAISQRRGTEKRRSSRYRTSSSAAEDTSRREKSRRVAVGS